MRFSITNLIQIFFKNYKELKPGVGTIRSVFSNFFEKVTDLIRSKKISNVPTFDKNIFETGNCSSKKQKTAYKCNFVKIRFKYKTTTVGNPNFQDSF